MKKILSILLLFAASVTMNHAFAQRAGEYNLSSSSAENWSKSGLFVNATIGVGCGDLDSDFGFSVGLGYRYHFGNGLSWDVAKVTYSNPQTTYYFDDANTMSFLTGVRYLSMPILAGKPLYGNFAVGYQMNISDFDSWHGFAYEIGAGVALSRTISVGLVWEGDVAYVKHYDNANFGIFGARLGINF
ncbi:MAG: hypothetical protein HDS11_03230 [Bacteroides sp.]|nr:hypothetical protein [Bacteroides sp.]MBD5377613.1 hypothetical protein [Bacteroides sp.]